jgi:hypothetical protein
VQSSNTVHNAQQLVAALVYNGKTEGICYTACQVHGAYFHGRHQQQQQPAVKLCSICTLAQYRAVHSPCIAFTTAEQNIS